VVIHYHCKRGLRFSPRTKMIRLIQFGTQLYVLHELFQGRKPLPRRDGRAFVRSPKMVDLGMIDTPTISS
jgi:hypothetical protein